MLLADFSTQQQLSIAVDQVRADADAILDVDRVVGAEYLSGTAPFQDQIHVRALVFDFLSHHALMLREWADRTERATAEWDTVTRRTRDHAAKTAIRATLRQYPPARP